jgi:hypothetical protein
VGPMQHFIQRLRGVKRPERIADHTVPSRAEVRNVA